MAVNYVAESALDGCKQNVQMGNHIHLSSAAAVSDAKRNHLFDRTMPSRRIKGDDMKLTGIFLYLQFHPENSKSSAGSGYPR